METAGIIAEYNPLHMGHVRLLEETRRLLGPETAVICVMSGNFVQRGDFALLRKHARAAAAVQSGADLVLELPLPWAVASAERFARGAVRTLAASGLVTRLAFGSECGESAALDRLAAALLSEDFPPLLKQELAQGDSFAAARQRAAAALLSPADAALLEQPNNILGVEYCKELLRLNLSIRPLTVKRTGGAHDQPGTASPLPSASAIRALLQAGETEQALSYMAPAMAEACREELRAGRAPVFRETCERAMLARLRTMDRADFAALDQGREGLGNRLYRASRTAASLEELLASAKTKRYAHARLRRMVLWAFLGLSPAGLPEDVPYLRPLAANAAGRALLGRMRKTAAVPVLTRPAGAGRLSPQAQALFSLEVRASDLYTLAYPDLAAAQGGGEWREGPAML